ncbi:hypothetical protein PQX77_017479, partial [Marasmius sp. AFHP31]
AVRLSKEGARDFSIVTDAEGEVLHRAGESPDFDSRWREVRMPSEVNARLAETERELAEMSSAPLYDSNDDGHHTPPRRSHQREQPAPASREHVLPLQPKHIGVRAKALGNAKATPVVEQRGRSPAPSRPSRSQSPPRVVPRSCPHHGSSHGRQGRSRSPSAGPSLAPQPPFGYFGVPPFVEGPHGPGGASLSRHSSAWPSERHTPMSPPWAYMGPGYPSMMPQPSGGHQQPFFPYGMYDPRAFNARAIPEEDEEMYAGGSGDEGSRIMKRKGDEHSNGNDGKQHKNRQQ